MQVTPVSAHFSLDEFRCHDGTEYPTWKIDDEDPQGRTWRETRLQPLVDTLEVIRETIGQPLIIDSGYRTLAYDQRLYDAEATKGGMADPKSSQHPKGRAADIRCGSLTAVQLRNLIGSLFIAGKLPHLGGLGLYPSFVHVDVRPRESAGHLAQWGASRLTNIV